MQSAIQTGWPLLHAYLLWGIMFYVYYTFNHHDFYRRSLQGRCLEAEVHEPRVQGNCEMEGSTYQQAERNVTDPLKHYLPG